MRIALPLLLALAPLAACSDDNGGETDTRDSAQPDTTEETTPDTSEEVADDTSEVEDDTTADTTADGDTASCEHPCLDEFGKNDKSLCPAPQSDWLCKAGCCEAVFRCTDDADCATRGFTEGQCGDDRFACVCHGDDDTRQSPATTEVGQCYTWLCAVDGDCADGELCAGGACVAAPDDKGLAVRILERATVLTPGATYALSAEAYDREDDRIVLGVTPTWSSSDSDVASVSAAGVVTGGASAGVATITATHGDETATLTIENVVPAGDDITLVVRTELTWEPVTGSVLVIDQSTGEGVVEELPLDGIVRIATAGDGPWDVHVLADDNDWVSWLGLGAGDTRYLPVPKTIYGKIVEDKEHNYLEETELRNVGVITGVPDFTTYSYEGTLEIVLTTTGLSSALFDFSLPVLLGSDVKRYLDPASEIPSVDVDDPISVPGGIVFNLLGPAIPNYVLTAPKGHHRLWSLGGRLNINDVAEYSSVIFDAIGGGDLDFTKIVGAVFPLFRNFWSGYAPDVEVADVGLGADKVAFTSRLTTPMGVTVNLDVPALPAIDELGWADGLFLLSGAQTVDGFMVPLGLSGGADSGDKQNNPPDGIADGNEKTPAKDPFPLPIAPMHGGLQGPSSRYLVAAVAAAIPGSNDPRPSSGSAILYRWAQGEHPATDVTLPAFLGFPSLANIGADFDARLVAVDDAPGTELVRVLLKGKRGEHWTFYGVDAGAPLHVPNPADYGFEHDRFIKDALDSVLVNCMDFAAGVELARLGVPGGVALDLMLGIVERVSFIDVKNQPLPQ